MKELRPFGLSDTSIHSNEFVSKDISLVFGRDCLDGRCGRIPELDRADGAGREPLADLRLKPDEYLRLHGRTNICTSGRAGLG